MAPADFRRGFFRGRKMRGQALQGARFLCGWETTGAGPARCAFSVGLEFGGQTLRDSAYEASLR